MGVYWGGVIFIFACHVRGHRGMFELAAHGIVPAVGCPSVQSPHMEREGEREECVRSNLSELKKTSLIFLLQLLKELMM